MFNVAHGNCGNCLSPGDKPGVGVASCLGLHIQQARAFMGDEREKVALDVE
jgi:hypothetical protein